MSGAQDLPAFAGLREHMASHTRAWQAVYDHRTPQELTMLPAPWSDTLSFFAKMILLRVLRPDKVVHV